jgi:3-hydroxybutyryl-CoA dehydrogenase
MAPSAVRTIAVLGAGTMGRGIAQVAALSGFQSRLYDVSPAQLESARAAVHRALDKGVELGKVDADAARRAKDSLAPHGDLAAAVGGADLVIEAVPESMELKIEAFREVARHAPSGAVFATNTSALSITELAAATDRPERTVGMHFFNPVHLMKLVEVVRGLQTSDETTDLALDVTRRLGKESVVVRESPGFVTSRINVLIGNEAFRMLQEGVASAEDIDKALKLGLNHPMGPFEMVDLVGLDVRLAILEHLHRTLGDTYRPTTLHTQLVRAGRLGRKTGHGVYRYDPQGRRVDG